MNFNKKRPKIELSMRYSFWLGMIVVMICSLYILFIFVECFSVEGLENLEREDDYCLAYYSQNSSFFAGMKTNIYHSGN